MPATAADAGMFDVAGLAASASTRPPLVFVHGSYHAAWCFAEHFMPYFAERGASPLLPPLQKPPCPSFPPPGSGLLLGGWLCKFGGPWERGHIKCFAEHFMPYFAERGAGIPHIP